MQKKISLKRSLNGILLLDKPIGMSSNKALKKVQHLFLAKKAGHTGSLDPLATGLLPICLGEATKLSQYLLEADKTYVVTAQLGQRTTTADSEGEVIAERMVPLLAEKEIEAALENFRGEIEQVPPIYSALKLEGKPLYKYAREGVKLELKSRCVKIYHLKYLEFSDNQLKLEVHCSKGTYIRSLVDDLGELLGCGAHVIQLRRIETAGYKSSEMISLEQLENEFDENNPEALDHYLIPLSTALPDWPSVNIEEEDLLRFQKGQNIRLAAPLQNTWIKVYDSEATLLGLAEVIEHVNLAPRKVFNLD